MSADNLLIINILGVGLVALTALAKTIIYQFQKNPVIPQPENQSFLIEAVIFGISATLSLVYRFKINAEETLNNPTQIVIWGLGWLILGFLGRISYRRRLHVRFTILPASLILLYGPIFFDQLLIIPTAVIPAAVFLAVTLFSINKKTSIIMAAIIPIIIVAEMSLFRHLYTVQALRNSDSHGIVRINFTSQSEDHEPVLINSPGFIGKFMDAIEDIVPHEPYPDRIRETIPEPWYKVSLHGNADKPLILLLGLGNHFRKDTIWIHFSVDESTKGIYHSPGLYKVLKEPDLPLWRGKMEQPAPEGGLKDVYGDMVGLYLLIGFFQFLCTLVLFIFQPWFRRTKLVKYLHKKFNKIEL